MRRRLPIRLRLTIAFAGVLAVVLGASGVVLYTELARDLDDTIDAELRHRTADFVALVGDEPDAAAALAAGGEPLAQVYGSSGRLIASTRQLAGTRLLRVPDVRGTATGPLQVDRRQTPAGDVRVLAVGARTEPDRPVVVAIGNSLASRDGALNRLETLLLGGSAGAAAGELRRLPGGGCGARPVERMRRRAEQITERDTAERLPGPGNRTTRSRRWAGPSTRCSSGLTPRSARERRLLSDASHELRTPLAVLRTGSRSPCAGARRRRAARGARVGRATKRDGVTRSPRTCWSSRARIRGGCRFAREPLEAGELLEAAARRATRRRPPAGELPRRGVTSPGRTVLADPDRAGAGARQPGRERARPRPRARSARARDGGRARRAARDRRRARLPGAPPAHAFERFSQGERAHSGEGSGIGLAIVAAIAHAHGGETGARNLPAGGADVWITLPAA